jgi:hypothetical protein
LQGVYDPKTEEIGPGVYRFKAEIGRQNAASTQACEMPQCYALGSYHLLSPFFLVHADFSGDVVVERHIARLGKGNLSNAVRLAAFRDDDKAIDALLKEYGAA